MIKISVIVPAYNRPDTLKACLNALAAQSASEESFEVIIVAKNTAVLDVAREFSRKKKNFFVYESITDSPSNKRNIGLSKARGKIVAFTDDDCIPNKNWVASILDEFLRDSLVVLVEGLTYTSGKRPVFSNAPENLFGGKFPTCNLSFRKEALKNAGGFDEGYYFYREDTDAAFSVLEYGRNVFSKKVRVFHPQRIIPSSSLLRYLFLVRGDFRLLKKYPREYVKFIGFPLKSDLFKSGITLLALVSLFCFVSFSVIIAVMYLFIRFFSLRKYVFRPIDWFLFIVLSILKDLALPAFVLVYFFRYYLL
jgi:glycosyltransferase involved in cell wall biosynthesis